MTTMTTGRAWHRTSVRVLVAAVSVAMVAALMILAATPEQAAAQDATTCYAIADSNQPGNLNSEGEVDTLVRIDTALGAPTVSVIGGNGGLGTDDTEAMAIRPLPDGTFQMHGWESGLNLFTIDPDTATTSGGPFAIGGKVEGLTWSGTDDDDATNDLLWSTSGSPASQVTAYAVDGSVAAGPLTVTVGGQDSLVDIAWDQVTGNVYAIITDDSDVTNLIQIDPVAGSASLVGATDLDMEGLGFGRNGQLVGTTGNDGENAFHLLDKASGTATLQADLDALTGAFDFEAVDCIRDSGEGVVEPPPPPPPPGDFDAVCYAISDSISAAISDAGSPDTLVRIDAGAGTAVIVGQIDGGNTTSVEAFAIRPGTGLYGFDPDTGGGRLFLIDENTGAITAIAEGLSALGDVDGMTFSGIADDDPSNDTLWMSIRNVGDLNDELVAVDPASGVVLSGPIAMDASGIPGVTQNDIDAIAWDPVTGSVFGTAGSGEANSLVTINPVTGAVTDVGAFGINDIEGLGFSTGGVNDGFLFGTTGKEDGDAASAFYFIDKDAPAASVQLIDLNAATGVTDFESVDCIGLDLDVPPPAAGTITATLTSDCVDGDGKLTVTVSHVSGDPVDYSVVISGEAPVLETIAAGDPDAMVMTDPDLADGTYTVAVTDETSNVAILQIDAPVECDEPPVLGGVVTSTCEEGAGKITASLEYVSGEGDGTFVVSVTGQPDQEVVLTEPGTDMAMFGGLADGIYNVVVTGNGDVLTAPQISVVCTAAAIDIELMVNGEDADTPTGPEVPAGEQVVFKYTVTNIGSTLLTNVQVTDSTLGAITCPTTELAPLDSIECMAMAAANPGQYTASATVVGTPPSGPNVLDEDPGNYFGVDASISITKTINGEDASVAPGPIIPVGEDIEFAYVVVNDGNTVLIDVTVVDSMAGEITCPSTELEPGAQMTCVLTDSSVAGEQSMDVTVTAMSPDGASVDDSATANYFGEGSGISIETTANGDDGLSFAPGTEITIKYTVVNIGNTTVSNVLVTDDELGDITCPQDTLLAGEMMMCTVVVVAAVPGSFSQTGSVAGLSETGTAVSDSDPTSFVITVSALGDKVFVDLNQNGTQDPSEPGVAGVTVNLWIDDNGDGAPDEVVDSTVTDEAGMYLFDASPGVDYIVQFEVPEGSLTIANVGDEATDSDPDPATGITGVFTVPADSANLDVDAGVLPASLGDLVFVDENADGQQSDGEPGIPGIVVNLWIDTDGDGTPDEMVADTTTDANGNYGFEALDPGLAYIVQFISDGRGFTLPNSGDDATDSDPGIDGITAVYMLDFGEENLTVDAGVIDGETGSIAGVLFIDANGNDLPDDGEGIPGVTVKITVGGVDSMTTTDGTGAYLFEGLAANDYNVMVAPATLPGSLIHTVDRESASGLGDPDNMSMELLDSGEVVVGVDFGYVRCAAIGDFVFSDLDGDGLQGEDEPGVSGLEVSLWTAVDGVLGELVATDTSDSSGAYGFDCVDADNDYIVQVAGNMGAALTIANAGDDTLDSDIDPINGVSAVISVDPGETNDTIDIGLLGGVASIDIETLTNMIDADRSGSGPEVGEGSTVTLTYVVTNDGPIDLVDVVVVDSILGELCVFDLLPAGEVETCTTSIIATVGPEYANTGSVIGEPVSGGAAVNDEDPTHHTVVGDDVAGVTINVLTNGTDGQALPIDSVAVIEYVVVNTGNVPLTDVKVTDSSGLTVVCEVDTLGPNDATICMAQLTVVSGVTQSVGTVMATSPDGSVLMASDPTSHSGIIVILPPVSGGADGGGAAGSGGGSTATGVGPISPNFTPPNPSGAVAGASGSGAAAGTAGTAGAGGGDAAALAITGTDSALLATFAVTSILVGAAFVAMSRRRERFE